MTFVTRPISQEKTPEVIEKDVIENGSRMDSSLVNSSYPNNRPRITNVSEIINGVILRRISFLLVNISLNPAIGALKPRVNLDIQLFIGSKSILVCAI